MHEITLQEFGVFSLVWLVAFAASIVRALRDNGWRDYGQCIAQGATAGFIAFGCCTIWVVNRGSGSDNPWYLMGLASLIGLMGKEQDRFARIFLFKVARVFVSEEELRAEQKRMDDKQTGEESEPEEQAENEQA